MNKTISDDPLWALYYENDAFTVSGEKIMGRQAAGNSMLKAYAKSGYNPIGAYASNKDSFNSFVKEFKKVLPEKFSTDKNVEYIPWTKPSELMKYGGVFYPAPDIDKLVDQRYFFGSNNYSIVGITHTTASQGAINSILSCYTSPLAPWDALICTSNSVKNSINTIYDQYYDVLKKRLGATKKPDFEIPVIPLGVHNEDYQVDSKEIQNKRDSLDIGKDDIVILFLGRLSFHAKAHHVPMYIALEEVSKNLPKDVNLHLIQTGWFPNNSVEEMYKVDAKRISPSVRMHFLDGRDQEIKKLSYAVADIFISLVDNFQETFGLTPLEGMAAGLPVVVSDWDGYKDTVRNEIDGFTVNTTTMKPGSGFEYALRYNFGVDNYDHYIGRTSQTVSVDIKDCIKKITLLATNKELRLKLGLNAKKRAKDFEWDKILKKYKNLKDLLDNKRKISIDNKETFIPPVRIQDPHTFFNDYASFNLNDNTIINFNGEMKIIGIDELYQFSSISYLDGIAPDIALIKDVFSKIKNTKAISFKKLMLNIDIDYLLLSRIILWLSKYGFISLEDEK